LHLFKHEKRFHPRTGEPTTQLLRSDEIVCDYCGRVLDPGTEDYERISPTVIKLAASDSSEAWFDQDYDFLGEGRRVEIYEFYHEQPEFHFCVDWNVRLGCDAILMAEWMSLQYPKMSDFTELHADIGKEFNGKKLFPDDDLGFQICQILSASRYRVVRHLLEQKYKPEELGLTLDD